MNRSQLEHILRAAAAITGADEFIVIGSQALLGEHPELPAELTASIEAMSSHCDRRKMQTS